MKLMTDHFHVHIVNANQTAMMGMAVGQAHLLDDIISLVRLGILAAVCGSNGSNSLRWNPQTVRGSLSV